MSRATLLIVNSWELSGNRASVLGEQSIGLWITKHLINHNKASN
ncbi:hypothetical protein HMPREF2534_03683 [Bacteroides thetaiotaomicron]|nr:hypothetical protein HMPREF2534_03683 [Bacteroides thetaiotaomicron]